MMKKLFIILIITSILGCTDWGGRGQDDLALYKGITLIPDKCIQHGEDVCGLFDCMVDRCWCDEVGPKGPVLSEGVKPVESEQEAVEAIRKYLQNNDIQYKSVERAVKLNDIFFNVFASDKAGDEMVYTVAVDGTIILTQCGV